MSRKPQQSGYLKKIGNYLLNVGQLLLIPVATFLLFAPSRVIGIVPGQSSILGLFLLIIAAVVLMASLFAGLKQALIVSVWTCLWVTIVFAYETDRLLPQPAAKSPPGERAERSLGALGVKPRVSSPDGLAVVTFAPEVMVVTVTPTPRPGLQAEVNKAIGGASSVVEGLASSMGVGRDQSIDSLPKDAFFPAGDKGKKRYGFSDPGESDSGGGSSGMMERLFSFLGVK